MKFAKIARSVAVAMLTAAAAFGGGTAAQAQQGSIPMGQPVLGSLNNLAKLPNIPTNLPNIPLPSIPAVGAQKRTFNVGGINRTAIVRVPVTAVGRKLPIVFMFGGWQHSAERTQSYSQLEFTGAGKDAIIVYPQGVADAWEGAPYAQTARGQDVALVRTIADTLGREGFADRNRVYAAGLSNGGGMAMSVACQAPGLVRAVVSVSGAHYNPTITGCAGGAVPTLLVHGTADDVIAYGGGVRHGAPFFSAPEVLRNASTRNGCAVGAAPVTSGYAVGVDKMAYPGCGAETMLLRVAGGGHTWYPANPNAAHVAWDFFSRH